MSSLPLGMLIEALVALLLLITIGYCWMLNRRLQRLRADEEVLRATISELMTATEIAERAILGLKTTAAEADKTLGARLKEAETMSSTLAREVGEGEKIFTRISQIAEAARAAGQSHVQAGHSEGHGMMTSRAQTALDARGYGDLAAGQHAAQTAPDVEPDKPRRARASDIRSAAAEAAARLEQFRKRKGAAA